MTTLTKTMAVNTTNNTARKLSSCNFSGHKEQLFQENMKQVTCLAWVPRGIPALKPRKAELNSNQLGDWEDTKSDALTNMSSEDERFSDSDDTCADLENSGDAENAIKEVPAVDIFPDIADSAQSHPIESISDDEDEDFLLKADDNLVLFGCCVDNVENILEVHVYNEAEDSYYPHHHYMLEEAPLCIEHVIFNKDTRDKGNFCAVGTMDSAIELWNLDVVEAIEPVAIFGIRNQSSETEKKKTTNAQTFRHKLRRVWVSETLSVAIVNKKISHENGVLSLTWNRILSHILASGSADFQIILWDIENQLGSAVLSGHSDKVQSIKWHPTESSRLLSGDTSGVVKLWDARESVCEKEWNEFNAEIERVAWNPWKSENFFVCLILTILLTVNLNQKKIEIQVAASDGRLYNMDIRSGIVDVTEAHNGAVLGRNIVVYLDIDIDSLNGLSVNNKAENYMMTSSARGSLKLWKLDDNGHFKLSKKYKLKMNDLLCCEFCPDEESVAACGGENGCKIVSWNIGSAA
ncbi:Periodic tryptophan protein 1 -like protein [Trichinella murrelli]|uniref:Periodic tryptophan protein 1-like protein n=1 Tax=Trichinella murrelli TaxID=144512 RepID=A0A0V0TIC7_9BILA|nr:Periodic tryptophan protein 1 -like protein [Trichinella murrelli]